jgi:RimJ/RimL family protein N-acetyltransferase
VLTPFVLESDRVRLEPLTQEHAGPLAAAAAADRSSYRFTWVPDGLADAERYVAAALADQAGGRTLAWAVRRRADNQIAGCTRVLDLEVFGWPPPWPPGVGRGPAPADDQPPTVAEIGSTWYAGPAQRTGLNAECKLLLLTRAFDGWGTLRVTLKTDARNAASRRAIERLGAALEGVRRAHAPASDGTIRDTAYYSIVQAEWPGVREHLRRRLGMVAGYPSSGPGPAMR